MNFAVERSYVGLSNQVRRDFRDYRLRLCNYARIGNRFSRLNASQCRAFHLGNQKIGEKCGKRAIRWADVSRILNASRWVHSYSCLAAL
jgi:hypothetical protein